MFPAGGLPGEKAVHGLVDRRSGAGLDDRRGAAGFPAAVAAGRRYPLCAGLRRGLGDRHARLRQAGAGLGADLAQPAPRAEAGCRGRCHRRRSRPRARRSGSRASGPTRRPRRSPNTASPTCCASNATCASTPRARAPAPGNRGRRARHRRPRSACSAWARSAATRPAPSPPWVSGCWDGAVIRKTSPAWTAVTVRRRSRPCSASATTRSRCCPRPPPRMACSTPGSWPR